MRVKKAIKRIFKKAILLLLIFLMAEIPMTAAFYSDTEISEDNYFRASSLDLIYSSPTTDFLGGPLVPGGAGMTREVAVENVGLLPFNYSQEYEYLLGDPDLCAALYLEVNGGAIYSGPLTSFSYVSPTTLAAGGSGLYDYEVTLPSGVSSLLRNKTCQFNLRARAWQVGMTYGDGYWDTEVLASTVDSDNWPPPAPTLVYPADGTVSGLGSEWDNNPRMDWDDLVWDDPVTYIYQSSLSAATNPDGSFTSPAYTSAALTVSEIPAPGTPNGTYYWHVQACDAVWGCGDWSAVWSLTVDRTIQEANLGDVVINELMWMGSTRGVGDHQLADEWIELRNMTSQPILLKNWVIENGGTGASPNLVIPAGYTLPADGFLLIANYSETDANSNLNVTPDWVTTGVELANTGEQLTLRDAMGNLIDQTPTTDGNWATGTNDNATPLKQSMERNDTPGSGTNDADWHVCVDPLCNDATYWDTADGANYGTPSAANLSANDPTSPVEPVVPLGEPVSIEPTEAPVSIEPTTTPLVSEEASPTPTETPPVSEAPLVSEAPPAEPLTEEPTPTPTESQPEPTPPMSLPEETPPALPTEEVSQ